MLLNGRKILITGGTGSLGKEIARQLLKSNIKKIIIYSRDEHKQVELKRELNEGDKKRVRYFIGDVRDKERLIRAFRGVDCVIHCAAMKHIDVCAYNPFEAVKTNILGSQNIIEAAIDCNVKRVLAVSTDKAVDPTTIYGGAKFCADKMFLGAHNYVGDNETRFSVIRYGNFWGSRGSVIPLFEKLRDEGCMELPITHIEMTRYFIKIEEAGRLAIKALEYMQGNHIFVPKMVPMKIVDIASTIHPKAKLVEIGIRPGEKLHEKLMSDVEKRNYREDRDFYMIGEN